MTLREELIQVAAVAVAIVEDLDYGAAHAASPAGSNHRPSKRGQVSTVLDAVAQERFRQDAKWGPQHHSPAEWLAILMEEVGEAAEEVEPHSADMAVLRRHVSEIKSLGLRARLLLDRVIFPREPA